jgi:pimeloyl-ACP methyl ester carboxylesterase
MLALNGQAIAYEMEGEGVPLLFIHQVATDRRIWRYQRKSLSQRYRLIAVDVLGHGEIAGSPQGFSLEDTVDQLRMLLTQLRSGPTFVIGVSMGASIAIRLALGDPASIRGLVLISPWSFDTSKHTRNLIERLFRLAEAGDMASHADFFLRYTLPPVFLERHSDDYEALRTLVMEQDPRAIAYSWAAYIAADVTGTLKDLQVPSLVISGFGDLLTPPYLARALANELPTVELEVWEEAGHFPFFEDPARFNRRVEKFIRQCMAQ